MIDISVIVPLYRGQKYIVGLIQQIEKAANLLLNETIELIFINDDPFEEIELPKGNGKLDVSLYNNKRNIGIHASRIEGLNYARGKYILFLDQDDRIYENYFRSQLEAIGNVDAVVCNLIQDKIIFYESPEILERSLNRNFMIHHGNHIISPGQVLIKKESIPETWTTEIISSNGADDWYLWICMLADEKRMVGNYEVLFEHIVHESNTSSIKASMLRSLHEVERLALKNVMLSDAERDGIADWVHAYAEEIASERDSLFKMVCLFDKLTLQSNGCIASIACYLKEQGIKELTIYGMGRVGRYLETELSRFGLTISGFIDRNAKELGEKSKVLDEIETTDCTILVSLLNPGAFSVKKELEKRGFASVYLIEELAKGN